MDMINKIKIDIAGSKYIINSKEEPEYVQKLADEINRNVEMLIENCGNLSLNDALVLTVLNYADSYKKAEQNADHLRSQLTDYLEDSARYRIEAEEAKREIQSLKREIEQLTEEKE
ncbi:MAG: cell division protein ZapA [Oscillospiraceae bacterium]